ncbi:MAG: enoyl-CoA hydratase/isomerase family protein [Saprospiraceae bacterium]|nr:enoyl-CoA hydratase/isomerase family protein [Saprospiraceae bacterium]MBK7812184.1 enoyl-CoA hydratase/isomerase family protein [Saprospiraceae bacterium]MBK9632598.1 enoyl-CoA hydratase/isomerase family protein [Saprospiraceae bacterium]
MSSFVKVTEREFYTEISFFTEQSNSLPSDILQQLAEKINEVSISVKKNIILLKSEGEKAFCAGASFEELSLIDNLDQGIQFFSGFSQVILALKKSPKIVIGRIHGKAVGGGVGLAAACDYSMATHYSSVRLSELAVGIGPFVIGPAVERKIGISAFTKMALNATEWQTADWAKQNNLFHEVFQTTEQLDQYIESFCSILANSNPEALSELKCVFWQGTTHWEELMKERAAISGKLVLSQFTKNAIAKFKQK